jgi:hypothetical protein
MPISCSEDQFNANASKYAVSDVHRAGPSLPVLLELAAPVASDYALDVATGTGHTALAVAGYVKKKSASISRRRCLSRRKGWQLSEGSRIVNL